MNTLTVEVSPLAQEVTFTDDDLVVTLVDGRKLSVPIVWFPRLANATLEQLHWPDIDEDLSIAGLLRGTD